MAKSPEEMARSMIANLKEKTGKALGDWIDLVQQQGETAHGKIIKWLKTEHGVTHGYANLIAHMYRAGDQPATGDELIETQYSGAKSGLRPIYEAIVSATRALGEDVEFAPKKAYVSLRRNKQFGLVQPSTRTRVDLGLKLKGVEPQGRLEASGSFNAMVSHRVRLQNLDEMDDEVVAWLKAAYEQG